MFYFPREVMWAIILSFATCVYNNIQFVGQKTWGTTWFLDPH